MSTISLRAPTDGSSLSAADRPVSICVGIATRGRPAVLKAVVDHLRRQSLAPTSIIVSCTGPADAGDLADDEGVTLLCGPPGLARQRNAVLQHLPPGTDIVVFFDDDFFAHPTWLEVVADRFRQDPRVACITGHVIADGIKGPGLSPCEAIRHLSEAVPGNPVSDQHGFSPYGCNMAFRCAAIEHLRFDERLVLYGWLEDRDFGATVARRGGHLLKLGAAIGVHCGVKSGRVSGAKLGYSQVSNPAYMRAKGTMSGRDALHQILRNAMANLVLSFRPEPYVDRRGRLWGNMLALSDIVRGRLTPERAERL